MTINRNAPAFGHKDQTVSATPTEGANNRKPFTFDTPETLKIDPGIKAAAMKGLKVGPVAVVSVAADPTAELKLSVAAESWAFFKHLGHSGVRFNLTDVLARRGMTSVTFQLVGCLIDGGFGIDTGADSPPSDTIKIKFTDCLIDGVSVYAPAGG